MNKKTNHFINYDFFLCIKPIIAPKIPDVQPNKIIPNPMSLDVSKKIPPMQATINPGYINDSGFSFNNFFIISYFTLIYLKSVGNESWEAILRQNRY